MNLLVILCTYILDGGAAEVTGAFSAGAVSDVWRNEPESG